MSIVLGGKTVLVIGARRTGIAIARYLARSGATVRLVDRSKEGFDAERKLLEGLPIEWRLGEESEALLDGVDMVVPSPGVPRTSPLLRAAIRRGLPIRSEIELSSRFLSAPVLAVTGTNGKSTTTELLGRMLEASGRRVFVGGNLGTPLALAIGEPIDCAVVEVSSYQLEWTDQFAPAVGIFLNLTPDHLERYASLDEYGETKARLFARQHSEDWAVLSREDAWVWGLRERVPSRVVSFGFGPVEFGAYGAEGGLAVRLTGSAGAVAGDHRFTLSSPRLQGIHNLENAMAAATAALVAGATPEAVQRGLDEFPGLPHRLERVREKNGITFVDDSKGTNVGAALRSLESVPPPVIWLAGGVDKGSSYEPLRTLVRGRVKRLIAFGPARERLASELGGETDTVEAVGLEDAVRLAAEGARPGDTVLLSPACASFDEFRDYAERGERFRALVEAL